MQRHRIITGILAVCALVGVGGAAHAQTVQEDIIVIPVDSVLRAPAGSVTSIASSPVPAEFQGAECVADIQAVNQESVHPNNDLLISSGSSSAEVLDVESVAFGQAGAMVDLTLGATVDLSLRMGPDEVSSGGLIVTIDCPLVVPPTTEAPSTTVPSTEAPTVTTAPPTGVSPGGATPGQSPGASLPETGAEGSVWMAVVALSLLAGGGALVRLARRTS